MLSITALTAAGGTVALPVPETLELTREYGVPADALTVRFTQPLPTELCSLVVHYDGNPLFEGVVDEQAEAVSGARRRSTLYARSLAALLLDSECKPMTLANPKIGDVFCVTAEPVGFENELPGNRYRGTYLIEKGTSLWSALEGFLALTAGRRMVLRGRALGAFACRDTVIRDFSGCAEVLSFQQTVKRCAGVAEVRYKTRPEEDYIWSHRAANAGEKGTVRYLNLAEYPAWQWQKRLNRCLKQGGAPYEATAVLKGYVEGEVGDRVLFGLFPAHGEPLYLSGIRRTLAAGEWRTRFVLHKAGYFEEG